MYQNELLDAYKKAQNYIQDKQIAMDMNIPQQRITDFRKERRHLSDSQALFLAQGASIEPELALLGCQADRNENPIIKKLWEDIAKKLNSQGLQRLSMACGGLAMFIGTPKEAMAQCALYILC